MKLKVDISDTLCLFKPLKDRNSKFKMFKNVFISCFDVLTEPVRRLPYFHFRFICQIDIPVRVRSGVIMVVMHYTTDLYNKTDEFGIFH
jgi:hypothetical protein